MITLDSEGIAPARRGEAWIDEDIRTLREMYLAGRNNEAMARALERTQAAIAVRLSSMKRRHLLRRV